MTLRDCADKEIVPWGALCGKGATILKSIEKQWESLINDPSVKESKLHEFLSDHSSLFFGEAAFTISRAELGSDFQVDFVIATDEASYGINYTFVEIETPQSLVYTRSGDPSARLTHALQQVLNWKAWLARHRGHVRRFFPSEYFGWEEFANLSFCIVVGRRSLPTSMTAKRNVLARETGIKIHSFDYLTDMLRLKFSFLWNLFPTDRAGLAARNQLANPFARAYSWRAWRKVVEQRHFEYSHFVDYNAEVLLAHRTYSSECDIFLRWWRSLPARKRAQYGSRGLKPESLGKMWIQFGR